MKQSPIIALTTGEPAGVGVDLCVDVLSGECPLPIVVFGDGDLIMERAKIMKRKLDLQEYQANKNHARMLWHCPLQKKVTLGNVTADNTPHVMQQLELATNACIQKEMAALITAPINKKAVVQMHNNFVGQTEWLAQATQTAHPVMILAGKKMRVALATRHLPLAQVANHLTTESLYNTFAVLDSHWIFDATQKPQIAVAGLNPHAGEDGTFGDEEARIITPAIVQAQQQGMQVSGPFAADSLFRFVQADCYVAMYHDQGLPVIKYADFDNTVNVTLGLPFLRVSPDHGPAAERMQNVRGDDGLPQGVSPLSMRAAVALAVQAVQRAS